MNNGIFLAKSVTKKLDHNKGISVSEVELACKEVIDHLHTDNPTWGARQMSAQLKSKGYHVFMIH